MEPQYKTKTKGYEFRYEFDMPVEFRKRVCTCEKMTYNFGGHYPTWFCSTCGKPPVHHLYKCFICDKVFIKDFSWPWYCMVDATCWDCSQDLAAPCLLHGLISMYKEKGYPLVEPLGLNPKVFTDEDMIGVLDFLDE